MKKLIILIIFFVLMVYVIESNSNDGDHKIFEPAYRGLNFIVGSYSKKWTNVVINSGFFSAIANEFNVFTTCDIILKTSNNVNSQVIISLPEEQYGINKKPYNFYVDPVSGNVKAKPHIWCGGIE